MATQEVRDTLANEIELLDNMIGNVQSFDGSGFTNQGKFIKGSWDRFLSDRRSTNAALLESSDAALKADLEEECAQVDLYINQCVGSPNYTESWRKFLCCEKEILEYLINLCP